MAKKWIIFAAIIISLFIVAGMWIVTTMAAEEERAYKSLLEEYSLQYCRSYIGTTREVTPFIPRDSNDMPDRNHLILKTVRMDDSNGQGFQGGNTILDIPPLMGGFSERAIWLKDASGSPVLAISKRSKRGIVHFIFKAPTLNSFKHLRLFFFMASISVVFFAVIMTLLISISRSNRDITSDIAGRIERSGDKSTADPVVSIIHGTIKELKKKEVSLQDLHHKEKERADTIQLVAESLTETIQGATIITDEKWNIVQVSQLTKNILNFKNLPKVGTTILKLFNENEVILNAIEKVERSRKVEEVDVEFTEEERFIRLTIIPLKDRFEQMKGYLFFFIDRTEAKRLEDIYRTRETLAQLGETAAGIAHEMRNSLGTILSFAHIAQKDGGTGDSLQSILKEISILRDTLQRFLDYAKPKELLLEIVSINEILDEVKSDIPDIAFVIQEKIPSVIADPFALSHCIQNVLRNAQEALLESETRNPVIEARGISVNNKTVRLSIKDNGPGIEPSLQKKIFTPFVSSKKGGTGMGLAITQRLISMMGGSIEVESREGIGATFNIYLPAANGD